MARRGLMARRCLIRRQASWVGVRRGSQIGSSVRRPAASGVAGRHRVT
jgi:hypothetical protein